MLKTLVSKRDHFLSRFRKLFGSPLQGRMGVVFIPGIAVFGIGPLEIGNPHQLVHHILWYVRMNLVRLEKDGLLVFKVHHLVNKGRWAGHDNRCAGFLLKMPDSVSVVHYRSDTQ